MVDSIKEKVLSLVSQKIHSIITVQVKKRSTKMRMNQQMTSLDYL